MLMYHSLFTTAATHGQGNVSARPDLQEVIVIVHVLFIHMAKAAQMCVHVRTMPTVIHWMVPALAPQGGWGLNVISLVKTGNMAKTVSTSASVAMGQSVIQLLENVFALRVGKGSTVTHLVWLEDGDPNVINNAPAGMVAPVITLQVCWQIVCIYLKDLVWFIPSG